MFRRAEAVASRAMEEEVAPERALIERVIQSTRAEGAPETTGLEEMVNAIAGEFGTIDEALHTDEDTSLRCGHVFEEGELAYHSRTYSADSTCVICSRCWEPELHEGTEWYVYRTGAGGVCDVGDAEAIDPRCWPERFRRAAERTELVNPLELVDAGVRSRAEKVVRALVHVLMAGVGGRMEAFDVKRKLGEEVGEGDGEVEWSVRIHDDDWHTYDGVPQVLRPLVGSDRRAMELTETVDQVGSAEILRSKNGGELRRVVERVQSTNLMVSLERVEDVESVERACSAMNLLALLGEQHDLLLDVVGEQIVGTDRGPWVQLPFGAVAHWREAGGDGHEHRERDKPENALEWLLGCDPLLPLRVRQALHRLCTQGLRRDRFRQAIARAYCRVAPRILAAWCRGVGSAKEHATELGVQILTTPSVAREAAAEMELGDRLAYVLAESVLQAMGTGPRLNVALRDGDLIEPLMQCDDLWDRVLSASDEFLIDAPGPLPSKTPPTYVDLSSVPIRTNPSETFGSRIVMVRTHLEYILRVPGVAALVLRSPRFRRNVFASFAGAHGMEPMIKVRSGDIPMERPSTISALNLSISLGTLGLELVRNALDDEDPERPPLPLAGWQDVFSDALDFVARRVSLAAVHGTAHPTSRGLVPSTEPQRQDWRRQASNGRPYFELRWATPPAPKEAKDWTLVADDVDGLVTADFSVDHAPVSFHAPLHRFIGLALRSLALETGRHTARDSEAIVRETDAWRRPVQEDEARESVVVRDMESLRPDSLAVVPDAPEEEDNGDQEISTVVGCLHRAAEQVRVTVPGLGPPGIRLGLALLEYPLRSLVLSSRVSSGLWVRNGAQAELSALNYNETPSCRTLRDGDLAAIHAASLMLPPNVVVVSILDRFGVRFLLRQPTPEDVRHAEHVAAAAERSSAGDPAPVSQVEEALRLFAMLATSTPCVGVEEDGGDVLVPILAREAAHKLMLGPQPRSKLERAAHVVVWRRRELAGSTLDAALEQVADYRPPAAGRPGQYALRDEAWDSMYDPAFAHLSSREHTEVRASWTERRNRSPVSAAKIATKGRRLCAPLPPTAPALACSRGFLFSSPFLRAIRASVAESVGNFEARASETSLRWALVLLSYVADMLPPTAEALEAESEARDKKKKKKKKDKADKKRKDKDPTTAYIAPECGALGPHVSDLEREVVQRVLLEPVPASEKRAGGSLVTLLAAVRDGDMSQPLREAAAWTLRAFSRRLVDVREAAEAVAKDDGAAKDRSRVAKDKERSRAAARSKMMASMAARQSEFLKHLDEQDDGDDDDTNDGNPSTSAHDHSASTEQLLRWKAGELDRLTDASLIPVTRAIRADTTSNDFDEETPCIICRGEKPQDPLVLPLWGAPPQALVLADFSNMTLSSKTPFSPKLGPSDASPGAPSSKAPPLPPASSSKTSSEARSSSDANLAVRMIRRELFGSDRSEGRSFGRSVRWGAALVCEPHAMHLSCVNGFRGTPISGVGRVVRTDLGEFQSPLTKGLCNIVVPIGPGMRWMASEAARGLVLGDGEFSSWGQRGRAVLDAASDPDTGALWLQAEARASILHLSRPLQGYLTRVSALRRLVTAAQRAREESAGPQAKQARTESTVSPGASQEADQLRRVQELLDSTLATLLSAPEGSVSSLPLPAIAAQLSNASERISDSGSLRSISPPERSTLCFLTGMVSGPSAAAELQRAFAGTTTAPSSSSSSSGDSNSLMSILAQLVQGQQQSSAAASGGGGSAAAAPVDFGLDDDDFEEEEEEGDEDEGGFEEEEEDFEGEEGEFEDMFEGAEEAEEEDMEAMLSSLLGSRPMHTLEGGDGDDDSSAAAPSPRSSTEKDDEEVRKDNAEWVEFWRTDFRQQAASQLGLDAGDGDDVEEEEEEGEVGGKSLKNKMRAGEKKGRDSSEEGEWRRTKDVESAEAEVRGLGLPASTILDRLGRVPLDQLSREGEVVARMAIEPPETVRLMQAVPRSLHEVGQTCLHGGHRRRRPPTVRSVSMVQNAAVTVASVATTVLLGTASVASGVDGDGRDRETGVFPRSERGGVMAEAAVEDVVEEDVSRLSDVEISEKLREEHTRVRVALRASELEAVGGKELVEHGEGIRAALASVSMAIHAAAASSVAVSEAGEEGAVAAKTAVSYLVECVRSRMDNDHDSLPPAPSSSSSTTTHSWLTSLVPWLRTMNPFQMLVLETALSSAHRARNGLAIVSLLKTLRRHSQTTSSSATTPTKKSFWNDLSPAAMYRFARLLVQVLHGPIRDELDDPANDGDFAGEEDDSSEEEEDDEEDEEDEKKEVVGDSKEGDWETVLLRELERGHPLDWCYSVITHSKLGRLWMEGARRASACVHNAPLCAAGRSSLRMLEWWMQVSGHATFEPFQRTLPSIPPSPLRVGLIALPRAFDGLVASLGAKGLGDSMALDLVTGQLCRAGEGAMTAHTQKHGGTGVWLLLTDHMATKVVLIRDRFAVWSPSPYVDRHGEEDTGLRRGSPLTLSVERYRTLQIMWASGSIDREVARVRTSLDRVIREGWY